MPPTASIPAPAVPETVTVFPEIAQAALRLELEGSAANWFLLRSCTGGEGRLRRADARRLIRDGRGVGARQARRLLAQGTGRFWTAGPSDQIWLRSAAKVARALGVDAVSPPRLISIDVFRGGSAGLKAALMVTCYPVDENGVPISRRRVRALTGIPESTQRRYENRYGHARVVKEVRVKLSHIEVPEDRDFYAHEFQDWGFYRTKRGDLMRRHADIRQALGQRVGSAGVARRVNRRLNESARGGWPATKARGELPPRVYFLSSGRRQASTAKKWIQTPNAAGKETVRDQFFDPVLNYGVIETRDAAGRRRFESAVQSEPPSGHRLEGSSRRKKDPPADSDSPDGNP